nr:MAG TPA: hypothetical protein [Caudoviricetes sp.]DAV29485.1 MAG TPA: hypothetical protein [Caudoviricetes sp.]
MYRYWKRNNRSDALYFNTLTHFLSRPQQDRDILKNIINIKYKYYDSHMV